MGGGRACSLSVCPDRRPVLALVAFFLRLAVSWATQPSRKQRDPPIDTPGHERAVGRRSSRDDSVVFERASFKRREKEFVFGGQCARRGCVCVVRESVAFRVIARIERCAIGGQTPCLLLLKNEREIGRKEAGAQTERKKETARERRGGGDRGERREEKIIKGNNGLTQLRGKEGSPRGQGAEPLPDLLSCYKSWGGAERGEKLWGIAKKGETAEKREGGRSGAAPRLHTPRVAPPRRAELF